MPALKRTRLTASAWRKANWCINCVLMRVMVIISVQCVIHTYLLFFQSRTSERPPLGELIEIADEYKGLVMVKGGDNLRNISTQTGAKVVRKQGEVYIASGTEEQRQQAKVLIKIIIVSIRQYGF